MSLTRNLDKAREAYEHRSVQETIAAHGSGTDANIPKVEKHDHQGQYLKSAVYGGMDGIITTFAVVAGVAGATLSSGIVLILGFANLLADGVSMAVGDYLSTKSEQEYNSKERQREEWEVENHPEGEKKEMIEIYMDKGFSEKDSKTLVNTLSKNKNAWVDTMMVQELGIMESDESPIKAALVTFGSFLLFGFIPLLAYVASLFITINADMFALAAVLSGAALFFLGSLRARFTGRTVLRSGIETLIVGGIAAIVAYFVGYFLSGLA